MSILSVVFVVVIGMALVAGTVMAVGLFRTDQLEDES